MARTYTNQFQNGNTHTRILIRGRWMRPERARAIARQIVLGLSREAGKSSRENITRALG